MRCGWESPCPKAARLQRGEDAHAPSSLGQWGCNRGTDSCGFRRTKHRVHIRTQLIPGPTWWPDPWCHLFIESIPTSSVLIFDGSTAFPLSEESARSWVSFVLSIGSPRAIQHWRFCLWQQKNCKKYCLESTHLLWHFFLVSPNSDISLPCWRSRFLPECVPSVR